MSSQTFEQPNNTRIKRDRWGRPMIIPPSGGAPVAYTRVSTLAKALDDTHNLTMWKCRMTAVGVATRTDLRALAASHPDDKDTLNRVVTEAMEFAGTSTSANTGTALHMFMQIADSGGDISACPAELLPDVEAYRAKMTALGVKVLASERFVVCDDLTVAGTMDRLVATHTGKIVVADIKSGASAPDYALSTAIQVATYAHGDLYDPDTGTRVPIPGVDRSVGLLIHVPQGKAECNVYSLDLEQGWQAARLAKQSRDWRKVKPVARYG